MNESIMSEAEARAVLEREEKRLKSHYASREKWAQKTHGCSFYEYTQRRLKVKREERDVARQALGLPPIKRGAPRKWAPRVLADGGAK
jgi:hypothetical protein